MRGVHRGVEQLADRAAGRGERRELELGRGQEVPPPPRARYRVQHGAERDLRRDREAVALVAQPRAGHGSVDGEVQRVEPGRRRPADQLVGDLPVLHDVELEPVPAAGVGRLHVLDRGGAEGRQRERDAGRAGRAGAGGLALGVHQPGEAGGGDTERERAWPAEDRRRRVDGGDVLEYGRVELHVLERLAGAGQGEFTFRRAVGVVERGPRRAAPGDVAQVVDGQRRVETALARVELRLLEPHELEDLARLRDLAIGHGSAAPRAHCGSAVQSGGGLRASSED